MKNFVFWLIVGLGRDLGREISTRSTPRSSSLAERIAAILVHKIHSPRSIAKELRTCTGSKGKLAIRCTPPRNCIASFATPRSSFLTNTMRRTTTTGSASKGFPSR